MVSGLMGGIAGGATVAIIIKAIDQFSGVFKNVNKGMLAVGAGITAIGIAGLGAITGLTKLAGQFEQTTIAFTTMLGSAEKADKLLKELADFASKTPFTITGIEQNAKMLLAMSIPLEDLLPTLKSLGDISSGLNVPLERLALNFGQVKVQGKLTGRELRDFSVAGVPLIAELAKNLNKSEAEIKDMVSAGKIGFDEVEKAFQTMTGEGGKFFDLMDKQSETLLGQISNIKDSFIKIARVMGAIFLPAAKGVAEKLAVLVEWFEQHPKIAKWTTIILAVGTALALIGGPLLILITMLPALTVGLGMVAGGMTAVSIGGAPLWAIILAIIAAIAALIAIGTLLYKNWDKIKEYGLKFYNFLKKLFAPQIAIIKLYIKAWGIALRWLWDNGLGWLWEKMKGFYNWMKDVFLGIFDKVLNAIKSVGKFIGKVADFSSSVGGGITSSGDKILGSRQSGGSINKTGLYKLHEGEFVVPKNSSGSGVNVFIENVIGLDPEEISRALSDELNNKVSL